MEKQYQEFNIGPGMICWKDMPEEYKQQYFEYQEMSKGKPFIPTRPPRAPRRGDKIRRKARPTLPDEVAIHVKHLRKNLAEKNINLVENVVPGEGRQMRDIIQFRKFNPLTPVIGDRRIDCVLHIATHLDESDRDSDSDGHLEDFIVTKRCIEKIVEQPISKKEKFRLELIISINGHVETSQYIKYFKSINNKQLSTKVFCRVFQRLNFGYHWGGFHDVWMRYKDTKCQWFATMECDHYFTQQNWFDNIIKIFETRPKMGDFGKHQNPQSITPDRWSGVKLPPHIWQNEDGSNRKTTPGDTIHTCGAFHFCKREVLERMDKAWGCFTFSMGCNHTIDGIVLGEVGFCHKVKTLGYSIESKQIELCVRPMRGHGKVEQEYLEVLEAKKKFKEDREKREKEKVKIK